MLVTCISIAVNDRLCLCYHRFLYFFSPDCFLLRAKLHAGETKASKNFECHTCTTKEIWLHKSNREPKHYFKSSQSNYFIFRSVLEVKNLKFFAFLSIFIIEMNINKTIFKICTSIIAASCRKTQFPSITSS